MQLRSFVGRNARTLLALGFLVVLVGDIFGAHGFLAMRRTQREIEQVSKEIQQLTEDNRKLADQVKTLKTDPKAIERIAREEMGLARPGELIYKLPAQPPKPAPAGKPNTPER